MANSWKHYDSTLEIIEALAEHEFWIASEEELSEKFDDEIVQSVIEQYGEDDEVAINEAFNNWADELCKNGELHELQYSEYCYVGKYF